MKRRRFTKTEKRDMRDNASLILSEISTAVGVAALVIALNRRPFEEEDLFYSEIWVRSGVENFLETISDRTSRDSY